MSTGALGVLSVAWVGGLCLGAAGCSMVSGLDRYALGAATDDPGMPSGQWDGSAPAPPSGDDAATDDDKPTLGIDAGPARDASHEATAPEAGPAKQDAGPIAFTYAPSNVDSSTYAPPTAGSVIDCDVTYDSSAHAFPSGFCAGRTAPRVVAAVPQSGGPPVDVLVAESLDVTRTGVLRLTGADAVVLLVFGNAAVDGSIVADGAAGTSGAAGVAASGPGGGYACSATAGGSAATPTSNSGGGGGGGSTAGGSGANACPVVAIGGVAGSARANASLSPLFGGCPGGTSGPGGCTASGGGGGGALQIAAAGAVEVTGTISAVGGEGGPSACTAPIAGVTYHSGGGGGGAGGAILLEGAAVHVTGRLVVQGGDGGSNGGSGATVASSPGGAGMPAGCDGSGAAGGGGGGGYGYLRLAAAVEGGV